MPTRRQFELMIVTIMLMHPVLGQARLWASKTLGTSNPGTVTRAVASTISVVS